MQQSNNFAEADILQQQKSKQNPDKNSDIEYDTIDETSSQQLSNALDNSPAGDSENIPAEPGNEEGEATDYDETDEEDFDEDLEEDDDETEEEDSDNDTETRANTPKMSDL